MIISARMSGLNIKFEGCWSIPNILLDQCVLTGFARTYVWTTSVRILPIDQYVCLELTNIAMHP